MIPASTNEALMGALRKFDQEIRTTKEWLNWEETHKFGIDFSNRRYPLNLIISLATKAPLNSYHGEKEAIEYLNRMGFRVVPLHQEINYWKITPGENADNWEDCKAGGYLAVGYNEFGDLSTMEPREFELKRDEITANNAKLDKLALNQIWNFAHIKKGDQVIASRGTTEMLGVATVAGSYQFISGERYGHRIFVKWDDLTLRNVDEDDWIKPVIRLDQKKFEDAIRMSGPVGCPFSKGTFDILNQLSQNNSHDFYQKSRPEFKRLVEEPFQSLFLQISKRMPKQICEVLETRDKLFAKVPKGGRGQGSSWDFYWGAFCPQVGKSTEDAQLFMWLTKNFLEFGFYIGEFGSDHRRRFAVNCEEHYDILTNFLQGSLADESFVFGRREDDGSYQSGLSRSMTWQEWLSKPEELGIRVARVIPAGELLSKSTEELVNQVSSTFEKVFPLILLAIVDDPVTAIDAYLNPPAEEKSFSSSYSLAQCAKESGFNEEALASWVSAIKRKGQAIIYGPPGAGKTYIAERLARHLVGGSDGFMDLVQFHPAYNYEDFMQGLRPKSLANGTVNYSMSAGRFLKFCKSAKNRHGRCVMIIDEVNRADIARVFGETTYLLEHRGRPVPLAGGGVFQIPANVLIIGTMNSADRQAAKMDYALRRRFAFIRLEPNFDVLQRYHRDEGFNAAGLVEVLKEVNEKIGDKDYFLGISYFLRSDLGEHIEDIWKMEVEPYLEAFFADDKNSLSSLTWEKVEDRILKGQLEEIIG